MSDMEQMKIDIELLKKDMSIVHTLCNKFDASIDKSNTIVESLVKNVFLQEQKQARQEEILKDIHSTLENRRLETKESIKELNNRIDNLNKEFAEKLEDLQCKILDEITKLQKQLQTDQTDTSKKFMKMDNWKFLLIGSGVVILWIVERLNISNIIKLLVGSN